MQYLRSVSTLKLIEEKCTACGRCVEVCPHGVLEMRGRAVTIRDIDSCMECGACMKNCEFGALTVRAGVGCAAAIIFGALNKSDPSCGCGGPDEAASACRPQGLDTSRVN